MTPKTDKHTEGIPLKMPVRWADLLAAYNTGLSLGGLPAAQAAALKAWWGQLQAVTFYAEEEDYFSEVPRYLITVRHEDGQRGISFIGRACMELSHHLAKHTTMAAESDVLFRAGLAMLTQTEAAHE